MSNLIKIENTDLGLVVSNRTVAEELGRRHSHVIRDLENILLDPDLGSVIFKSDYKDSSM